MPPGRTYQGAPVPAGPRCAGRNRRVLGPVERPSPPGAALPRIVFTGAMLLIATGLVSAPAGKTNEAMAAAFREKFADLYARRKFNGVVLVARRGQVLYQAAHGVTGPTGGQALQPDSVFNLASVSKQFTALAVLILMEQGKLGYDDALETRLPGIRAPGVKIRHLIHHTSGLAEYETLLDEHWPDESLVTNKDLLALLVQHQAPLKFKPGEKYEYSNTGYALLANVIERVSGQSYAAFLAEKIFRPAGMRDTFVCPATLTHWPAKKVIGFARAGKTLRRENETYMDGIVGDGGVCSSASDLLAYDRALYTDRILPRERLKRLYEPVRLNNGKPLLYGFGLELFESGTYVSHSGSWVGFNTFFARDLSDETVFIALDNSSNENVGDQIESVINEFYD